MIRPSAAVIVYLWLNWFAESVRRGRNQDNDNQPVTTSFFPGVSRHVEYALAC